MEQEEGSISVPVMWRGKNFTVTVNSGASLKELGDEVRKLTDVKADTLKLIVPQSSGKTSLLLKPFSNEHSYFRVKDTAIAKAKFIRMMGVSKDEVDEVLKSAKENHRIAGFEEEEMRMKMRMTYGPSSSPKLPEGQYIFCGFRTLELPGIELNPPPSEALKRMHMLAADPGIVAIMNKHRWRVGIMTELAPVGYVGISPKCLLGLNKNQGEEISLRLRTDDLKGFRKYGSIRKTLLHELAHMVHSEHDENFYALDKQLNQEATTLDWTRSSGHTVSGVRSWEPDNVDMMRESETIAPHKVGGEIADMFAGARAASVAAAYRRLSAMEQEEPDPDDLVLKSGTEIGFQLEHGANPGEGPQDQIKLEPDPDDSAISEYMESEPYKHGGIAKVEPDPDDLVLKSGTEIRFQLEHGAIPDEGPQDQIKLEPDPDDSAISEYMESEPYKHGGIAKVEPDPDDSEMSPILHIVATNEDMEKRGHGESPAQLLRDQNHEVDAKLEGESKAIEVNKFTHAEADSDDKVLEISGAEYNQQPEVDPVAVFCNRLTKAIEMLRAESNSTDVLLTLQTLLKITRNVLENPNDIKYKRLRKANSVLQKSIAKYKAAMEVMLLIGFSEDVVVDDNGKAETYLVLKRDDPGVLWLAKSFLESCIAA